MTTARKGPENAIYQIKVTLLWSSPPIWRRLLVPSDIALSELHDLVQRAMGWDDSHLHEFDCRGKRYGPTDPQQGGPDRIDECKVRLRPFVPSGARRGDREPWRGRSEFSVCRDGRAGVVVQNKGQPHVQFGRRTEASAQARLLRPDLTC